MLLKSAYRTVKTFFKCAYFAVFDLIRHAGIEYAGYLSFVVLLSLFPFLIFLTAVASNVLSILDKDGLFYVKLLSALSDELSHDTMYALLPRINEILSGPPQSLLTIAVMAMIWSASSVIEGIRNVLNKAFRVYAPPPYLLGRLFSIVQFLAMVLIVIFFTVCMVLIPILFEVTRGWQYFKVSIAEFMLFICVFWLYFVVPNKRQTLWAVMPGAVMVTILWTASSMIFSWYLSNFSVLRSIYGNLTGIVAALLFFYVLSILFIYGAELNHRLFKHMYHSKRKVDKTVTH